MYAFISPSISGGGGGKKPSSAIVLLWYHFRATLVCFGDFFGKSIFTQRSDKKNQECEQDLGIGVLTFKVNVISDCICKIDIVLKINDE